MEVDRITNKYYNMGENESQTGYKKHISLSKYTGTSRTLATTMTPIYNAEKPIVYNTLQMYRLERLAFLKKELVKAKKGNYHLGFKLVQGAYMEKGYTSPICKSKVETDLNFNTTLNHTLDNWVYI